MAIKEKDMKISEITAEDVANYLRLDEPNEVEEAAIAMFMASARDTVRAVTGLADEEIDEHADLVHPYFLLISDQFDNRNGLIENKQSTVNHSIMEALKRHAVNYL